MSTKKKRLLRKPSLQFTSGIRGGDRIEIQTDSCVIGRDPDSDIQLDSHFVSRRHAEVVCESGYWFIIDLHSKNGVFKNMIRLQPGVRTPLFDRDQVQISSVSAFTFQDPEATIHEKEMRMMSPGLWVDEFNRDVFMEQRRLDPPLSAQQFTLLAALMHRGGDVMTNAAIAEVLWPEAAGGVEDAAIDNAISRLRGRLAELDPAHDYIETVRGMGKRFMQREGKK